MSVFCDVHLTEMESVSYLWQVGINSWVSDWVRCTEPGCLRHFRWSQGYVDIDQQIHNSTRKLRRCPKDPKHGGSVAIVEIRDDEPIWRCIYEERKLPLKCFNPECGVTVDITLTELEGTWSFGCHRCEETFILNNEQIRQIKRAFDIAA